MATKTFKTRIKLKYDLQSAWDSSFSALNGELLLGKDAATPTKVFANVGTEDGIKPLSILTDNVLIKSGSEGNETYQTLTAKLGAIDEALGAGGSVAEQITAAINDLNADPLQLASADTDKITIKQIKEVNGKILIDETTPFVINIADDYDVDDNKLATVATVTTAVTAAQNTLQTDLTDLTTRVTTAEGDIDNLQTEMDAVEEKAAANETAISGLTTRVTTAEGEIDTLQSEMDAVEGVAGSAVQTIDVGEMIGVLRTDNTVTLSHKTVNPTQGNGSPIAAGIGSTEISIPVISFDETGHIKNNGTQKVTITIPSASDLGVAAALKFIGVTTSEVSDGSNLNRVTINGLEKEVAEGNVVIKNQLEFAWDGSKWVELGNASQVASDLAALDSRVTIAENDIDNLQTLTNTHGNEIVDLDSDLSALKTRVDTAESEIDTLQSEMDAVETKAAANETAISGLGSRLATAEAGLSGAINKNIEQDTAITNLETLVGTTAVATQITNAIGALDNDGEIIASDNDGIVTLSKTIKQTDGVIDIATENNTIALAKVAKTGDVNDLSQGTGNDTYIIFDCGDAEGWE